VTSLQFQSSLRVLDEEVCFLSLRLSTSISSSLVPSVSLLCLSILLRVPVYLIQIRVRICISFCTCRYILTTSPHHRGNTHLCVLEVLVVLVRPFIDSYIHRFIHPYIHTSIHPYIHTSIHPHIHTSIHPYIHTSIHPYIHTSIHPYIHTSIPTHPYPYIHISIHPHIHTSIHPCIHTSIHPHIHTSVHP